MNPPGGRRVHLKVHGAEFPGDDLDGFGHGQHTIRIHKDHQKNGDDFGMFMNLGVPLLLYGYIQSIDLEIS